MLCQLQPVFLEHVAVIVAGRIVRMWFLLGENPRKCVVKVWGTYSKPRSRGPFEHDTTPGAIPGTVRLCKTWAKTSDYEGSKDWLEVFCSSAVGWKLHRYGETPIPTLSGKVNHSNGLWCIYIVRLRLDLPPVGAG